MIYLAAILVVVYITIKLFPLVASVLTISFCSLNEGAKRNRIIKEEIKSKILSNYISYDEFATNFEGFDSLSKVAKRKVKTLFELR